MPAGGIIYWAGGRTGKFGHGHEDVFGYPRWLPNYHLAADGAIEDNSPRVPPGNRRNNGWSRDSWFL